MKRVDVCSGVVIDEFQRVLLIKRGRLVESLKWYWAVPSGKRDPGEELEDAVIRELKEEVNLEFQIERKYLETSTELPEENKVKHFHRFLWSATGKIEIQEEECDGYGWFSYGDTQWLKMSKPMKDLLRGLKEEGLL